MSELSATPKGPYRQEDFLDRSSEIKIVEGIVENILAGETPEARTVVFAGDRNMGKTWLSLHLVQDSLPKLSEDYAGRVTGLLYAFDEHGPPTEESAAAENGSSPWSSPFSLRCPLDSEKIAAATRGILLWSLKRLDAFGQDIENATLDECSAWLVRHVKRREDEGRVFVFIFDSISEADRKCLERLEEAMLAPLAEQPNVVVVMTGRPPLPRWTSTKLRVHVISRALKPFDEEQIREIIRRIDPEKADQAGELLRASSGNPGIVTRLAYMMFREGRLLSEALHVVIDEQLDVFGDATRRQEARRAFEHLCVLMDPFRETEMEVMLAEGEEERVRPEKAKAVRDLLGNANLLHWEKGGYCLDPSLCQLVTEYLRVAEEPRRRALYRRAAEMYRGYAKKYPRYQDFYSELADKHLAAINEVTQNAS